ncbi:acyl carrier protein [Streptomyces sp. CB02923]|uniref:acyl carrier protein n=1 Tax=Streptomyces sp. CB02923 TaxID=1718985 RepID=UPI00093B703F|nr:phosphopantetheine-binding protein [Streptomyces sp. CB02923]OKH99013.1 acyl carrier protein [Streptomyces sp. CB02923]
MTEQEFIAVLAPLAEEITGTAVSQDQLDASFGDLDIDSLNQVEIISRVEDEFDCRIEDSVLRTIRTPRGLMEHISKATATA